MYTHDGMKKLMNVVLNSADLGHKIHLFKNDYTPINTTLLADLTEADYPGYAAKDAVAESAPVINGDDESYSTSGVMDFVSDDDTDPVQRVYGVYVTFLDITDTRVLLAATRFDNWQTIALEGDKVRLTQDWFMQRYDP